MRSGDAKAAKSAVEEPSSATTPEVDAPLPAGSMWTWGELTPEQYATLSVANPPDMPLHHPERLVFQYFATRMVLRLRPKIEMGSGFAVLQAVAECARTGLAMPDWLAVEFLKRYRAVRHYEERSWDAPKSFGRPYPKGTNIAAKRKAWLLGSKLYLQVCELYGNSNIVLSEAIRSVASALHIGETLAEEYFIEQRRINPSPMAGAKLRRTHYGRRR
jgi:hypothetical protein